MRTLSSIWFAAALMAAIIPTFGFTQQTEARSVEIMNSVNVRPERSERAYFFNHSGDEQAVIELKDLLIERGAFHVNAFLPDYIACELPADLEIGEVLKGKDFSLLRDGDIALSSAAASMPGLDIILRSYEMAKRLWDSQAAAGGGAHIDWHNSFDDMVLTVPRDLRQLPPHMIEALGADDDIRLVNQNSEFLVGNILVNTIYPESAGGTENWTDAELSQATMGVYSAMLNFQEQFDYAPMNFTFKFWNRAATGLEPIAYEMQTDNLWINDVMQRMGYTPGGQNQSLTAVHAFNENWRKYYRGSIDWVYTAFVADSRMVATHRFDNGAARYTAYAYGGGPYLVIPFPAGENPYYIDETLLFSQVYQHEVVHIFWGLDEYDSPMVISPCDARSGYLNFINMNKINSIDPITGAPAGCQDLVDCLMQVAKQDQGRPICRYTRGQMGLIDANDNSVPDVFDSTPDIIYEHGDVETVLTSNVVVRATAISVPVPNRNPAFEGDPNKREYAAALKDAVLSVDGTGHLYLLPEDGKWDEQQEDVVFNLSGIPTGLTRIQLKVRTKVGIDSPIYTKRLYNLGLNYSFFTVKVKREGVSLIWNMIGEIFGATFDLYRIGYSGSVPDTMRVLSDISPSGPPQDHFLPFYALDSEVKPGESYHYFVQGSYTVGGTRQYRSYSGLIPATAMLPIEAGNLLSQVVPNPFKPSQENTIFSVDVPRSYRETGPGDSPARGHDGPGAASALKELIATPVDVVIYDVAGRRVKTIDNARFFSQAVTYQWNGTNENGDPVPSGIYFLKAVAGSDSQVRKIVLMR
jgi:hypothetical protein